MRYLLFLLLLIGCSPPREFPEVVHLDAAWTDDESAVIESALAEWGEATCTAYSTPMRGWTGAHGDGLAIYRADQATHDYMKGVWGTTWGDSVAIAEDQILLYDPSGTLLHRVALHEIGHLWGLVHEGSGTMSIDAYHFDCIDSAAVDQFCDLYDCGCERPTCPSPSENP